jgi:Insertion element 4 transposase N-terminal
MPQSAMSGIAPSTTTHTPDRPQNATAKTVREAVLAGPASGVKAGPALHGGFLRRLAGREAVDEALARAGHADARRRDLPGPATVETVLGLCLHSGEGYDSVLARVFPDPPTASALSQARARLNGEPLRELFELTAPAGACGEEEAGGPAPGSTEFGFKLSAFDGTVFDLAATEENSAEFAVPSGGKCPQARVVSLVDCGTRRARAAAAGSYATSEQELVDPLGGALRPGELNQRDRDFFSMPPLGRLLRHRRAACLAGQKRQEIAARQDNRRPARRVCAGPAARVQRHARGPPPQGRRPDPDAASRCDRPAGRGSTCSSPTRPGRPRPAVSAC